MGAAQGVPANNQSTKNVSEEDQLVQGILLMASQLYKQYYPKMNDVDLCQHIGLVASDKLEQFDTFTLKKVANKQNNGEVTLKPVFIAENSNRGELFEIERMPELPDYFANKYVSIPQGLDNTKTFTVPYLSNRIMNILRYGESQNNSRKDERRTNSKQFIRGKRYKRFKGKKFRGGNVAIVKKEDISPPAKENTSPLSASDLEKQLLQFKNTLEQIDKPVQPQQQPQQQRQNKPQQQPQQQRQQRKNKNRNERRNKPGDNKLKKLLQINQEDNNNDDDNDNENDDENNNENDNENNDNEENKNENLKKALQNVRNDIKNVTNNQKPSLPKNEEDDENNEENDEEDNENEDNEKDNEEDNEEEKKNNTKNTIKNLLPNAIRNVIKQDNKTENKPKNKNTYRKKKISKKDLCKLIAHHYMVRANLVAAIASALPLRTTPGFCQSRISALERGELCLPPDYEVVQSLPMLKASNILSKYVNNFNHGACNAVNGYYKRHDRERMLKIMEGDNELQKKYVNHVQLMKKGYLDSLAALKEILDELMTNPDLTNEDLKLLSEKTKEILDNMYANCQYDYVLGVITLLQIDYQLPRISSESMNNLKEALNARA